VSLNVYVKCLGGFTIVYCQGRLVFRDEALTLSEVVVELLQKGHDVVLDLAKVDAIDSAGLGELVSLYMMAKANGSSIKLCGVSSRVHHLLQITNLASLFEIFPEETAIELPLALEMPYTRAE